MKSTSCLAETEKQLKIYWPKARIPLPVFSFQLSVFHRSPFSCPEIFQLSLSGSALISSLATKFAALSTRPTRKMQREKEAATKRGRWQGGTSTEKKNAWGRQLDGQSKQFTGTIKTPTQLNDNILRKEGIFFVPFFDRQHYDFLQCI